MAAVFGNCGQLSGLMGEFREKAVVVAADDRRHKFRMMQEIEIVNDIDHGNV